MKTHKLLNEKFIFRLLIVVLTIVSIYTFYIFYTNGIGLAYNDARSHLNIGRRVVEGLKPGFAQLGSVWLPLPHLLMVPTIWNDFMWHSGLAGAIVSMLSYLAVSICIYLILKELGAGVLGRIIGVLVFAVNLNTLYLQSTAMTELLLLATMTLGAYEFLLWYKHYDNNRLIKASFWIMLASLVRYDGWFLMLWAVGLICIRIFFEEEFETNNFKQPLKHYVLKLKTKFYEIEGKLVLFLTLASFGIFLWVLWNLVIFKDPLYFILGPFSAKAQQDQLEKAGVLQTKYDLWLSLKFYWYATVYNSNAYALLLGIGGLILSFFDRKLKTVMKIGSLVLLAPFIFNVIALFFGHSVLFIAGLSGTSWFNIRYGIMMLPSIAVFAGLFIDRLKHLRIPLVGTLMFVLFISLYSGDAVTIDDARFGSSQKNVSEVSSWLYENAGNKQGYVLISAASHDAIVFSSRLPMKRFIHEGTGLYWKSATAIPDRWARWIIMRTFDDNDLTWKAVSRTKGFSKYNKVKSFPFADIYELKPEYVKYLNLLERFDNQK